MWWKVIKKGDMKQNTKNQANYKERQRAKGMEQKAIWAHKDDWPEINKFIENKKKNRADKVTSNN